VENNSMIFKGNVNKGIKRLAETVKAGARLSGKECADIPLL
jgi:hypothetical protein